MPTPKPSPLRALVEILSSAVQVIDDRYAAAHLDFPSLNDPRDPDSEAERLLVSDNGVTEAVARIVAAAAQIAASVEPPALAVINTAMSFHVSSSLSVVTSNNVAEILREAGPTGLHVDDIAKKTGSHPTKIGRMLRLLATYHIFREIRPNVFANNRLSSMIDSLKTTDELFAKPEEKHTGASALSAFLEHLNDGAFKTAAHLDEVFRDPKSKFVLSEEPTETAFNFAYKTDLSVWDWLEKPENRLRRERFAAAMDGSRKLEVPEAILKGFNWGSLPKGAIVVDVGGGIGSSSLTIAKKHPGLKIALQDSPTVIDKARKYWAAELPTAVSSNAITLNGHNFFDAQPVTNASVFLLRGVLHDWNDGLATAILRRLRAAATSQTRLVIVEHVLRYACPDTIEAEAIPGAALPSPPVPLLANYGRTSAFAYLLDLQMLTTLNAKERPLTEWIRLTAATGWKIIRVHHIPGSPLSHIVAEPASE